MAVPKGGKLGTEPGDGRKILIITVIYIVVVLIGLFYITP